MSEQTKYAYPGLGAEGGSIYWTPGLPANACYIEDIDRIMMIPLEDEVYFPYLHVNTIIKSKETIKAVKYLHETGELGFFFLPADIFPDKNELVRSQHIKGAMGTLGKVVNIEKAPDGGIMVEIVMTHQAQVMKLAKRKPFLVGTVSIVYPELINPNQEEFEVEETLENTYDSLKRFLSEQDVNQLNSLLNEIPKRTLKRISFMMQNSPLHADQRYSLLMETSVSQRRKFLISLLEEEKSNLIVKSELGQKTMSELGQRQREEFLRTQLNQIKAELGETDENDIEELRSRAKEKSWNEQTEKRFEKELRKLGRFNPTSPDYAVQFSYLDTLLGLPWLKTDISDIDLNKVEEILNRDHYGLEKVKERIIEQMAVMKLRKDTKSPIICLYGPPGVGKTSLGKSIAEATGRKYVRVALGGLHDEAEIRGHRRTYLGSMPGRIIQALEQAGTSNPVMVLDEIDKIGQDYKGDPEQALLEVLDPEQNSKFHDNYVDIDYDLSKVLFIATANSIQKLSSPLLDRMELIEISGYTEEEKIEIAKRHLISRDLKELGFEPNEIQFTDGAYKEIISSYTRESGVRKLEKKICEILRKIARLKASEKDYPRIIEAEDVKRFLGKKETYNELYEQSDTPGIVTGLAWTQAGGEILYIESSLSSGKEGKLTLTGNLGDVMKESAMLAIQYIKANREKLGLKEDAFNYGTLHIHVPEGAVPKDGPSAGITIVTSLASTFTQRKVKSHLAMTGEITLRGRVLPVGGVKEKILAAKRAGITTIILSSQNKKDIDEIKPEYLTGLEFRYVDVVDEVLDFALE